MECKVKIPVILKHTKVSGYKQIVSELRKIRTKNKDFTVIPVETEYKGLLKPVKIEYDLDAILNGFVSEKLVKIVEENKKKIEKDFSKEMKRHIAKLKKQLEFNDMSTSISVVSEEFESKLDSVPTESSFSNVLIFDIYTFLISCRLTNDFEQEISYLEIEYIKYIERFLKENTSSKTANINCIEDKISMFVNLKYGQDERNLEIYEGEYVFAKIYVFLRCGLTKSLFDVLDKFSEFLSRTEPTFKKSLSSWVVSKVVSTSYKKSSGSADRFKNFLFKLMRNEHSTDDSLIVSSVEDFLWVNLIGSKTESDISILKGFFKNFKNKNGLLLVYVMTKQYQKVMEHVFYGNLHPYESYFLLKELAKKCGDKKLFVEYTFLICKKLKNTQKKVELLNTVEQIVGDFYNHMALLIVKYKLFDVLEFFKDCGIGKQIVKILNDMNDRKQLLKIYKFVEDKSLLIEVLNDIFIEAVLTNSTITEYMEIYDELKKCDESVEMTKLETIYKFHTFLQNPNINTLKKIAFFEVNFNLVEVKYVVEKVLKIACEVIKNGNDYKMAQNLFRVVGEIELSDECIKYINRELVFFF